MTTIEPGPICDDNEKGPLYANDDIFNQNGELRPGVEVIDTETGECVQRGEVKFPASKFEPDHPLHLGDEVRGDYHELRDLLLQGSRHKILKAAALLTAAQIALLREHCWHIASYFNQWKEKCLEVGLILTRLLVGDTEYDLQLADDVFYWADADFLDDEAVEEGNGTETKGEADES